MPLTFKILLDVLFFVGGLYLGYYAGALSTHREWRKMLINKMECIKNGRKNKK